MRLYRVPNASAARRLMRKMARHYKEKKIYQLFAPRLHKTNMRTSDFLEAIRVETAKKGSSIKFLSGKRFREKKAGQNFVKEMTAFHEREKRQKRLRAKQKRKELHEKRVKEAKKEREIRNKQANLMYLLVAGNEALAAIVADALDVPLPQMQS